MLTFGLVVLYVVGCLVAADWGYRFGQKQLYAKLIREIKTKYGVKPDVEKV